MKHYDPTEESKFKMYLDANSLYGWPMSHYLPYGKFSEKIIVKKLQKNMEQKLVMLKNSSKCG